MRVIQPVKGRVLRTHVLPVEFTCHEEVDGNIGVLFQDHHGVETKPKALLRCGGGIQPQPG